MWIAFDSFVFCLEKTTMSQTDRVLVDRFFILAPMSSFFKLSCFVGPKNSNNYFWNHSLNFISLSSFAPTLIT